MGRGRRVAMIKEKQNKTQLGKWSQNKRFQQRESYIEKKKVTYPKG